MDRYPLHALRSLLSKPAPTRGIITAQSGARLTLATPQGMMTALAASDVVYRIGQAVRIRDGIAYPSAAPAERYVL